MHKELEAMFRGLLSEQQSANDLFVALHNTFTHGDIFSYMGYQFSDEQLGRLFSAIDELQAIVEEIENS